MDKCVAPEGEVPKCSKILTLNTLYYSLEEFFKLYKILKKVKRSLKSDIKKNIYNSITDNVINMVTDSIQSPFKTNLDIHNLIDQDNIDKIYEKTINSFMNVYKESFMNLKSAINDSSNKTKNYSGLCEDCDLRIECDLKGYQGIL